MAKVGDDIQTETGVNGDRFIECGIEKRNEFLQFRSLSAGPEPDPGQIALRRHGIVVIDAEVDPRPLEFVLDCAGNAGFTASRRTIQNYDLSGMAIVGH